MFDLRIAVSVRWGSADIAKGKTERPSNDDNVQVRRVGVRFSLATGASRNVPPSPGTSADGPRQGRIERVGNTDVKSDEKE